MSRMRKRCPCAAPSSWVARMDLIFFMCVGTRNPGDKLLPIRLFQPWRRRRGVVIVLCCVVWCRCGVCGCVSLVLWWGGGDLVCCVVLCNMVRALSVQGFVLLLGIGVCLSLCVCACVCVC